MVCKSLSVDTIHLLTESVQNSIQCQANVNATPGSDNCNDLVIGHLLLVIEPHYSNYEKAPRRWLHLLIPPEINGTTHQLLYPGNNTQGTARVCMFISKQIDPASRSTQWYLRIISF